MKDKFAKFFRDNKIPASENINPLSILTTDAEMAEWQNEKLPSDEVSLQNGAILTNSDRYSLMIDPQLQGITWIKQRYGDKQLQVTRLTNKRMINILETSIETGKPCLIENLENTIDAVI
jgi:dynein heavy chain